MDARGGGGGLRPQATKMADLAPRRIRTSAWPVYPEMVASSHAADYGRRRSTAATVGR